MAIVCQNLPKFRASYLRVPEEVAHSQGWDGPHVQWRTSDVEE